MKAKDYLGQVKLLKDKVDSIIEQLETLRDLATRTTSLPFDVVKVQSTGQNDKRASIVAKVVDLEQELLITVEELIDLTAEVITLIDRVPDNAYKLLLMLRYLNFKTWYKVAEIMDVSLSGVHTMHRKALVEFDKVRQDERS